jgi:Uma2 family endonuclease
VTTNPAAASGLQVQVSATHVRIPEISVLSADLQTEKIITRSPLVCIETLSKDDTLASMWERVADHAVMGVPNIWQFDPERREVWTCTGEKL